MVPSEGCRTGFGRSPQETKVDAIHVNNGHAAAAQQCMNSCRALSSRLAGHVQKMPSSQGRQHGTATALCTCQFYAHA